ncbi:MULTISPECIES: hypothetical protein [Bacteria]|uniref:hypothetical protein n=1 Tax=Bacteria TaxID=2 RepID=UPI00103D97BD|nr:MULTISPECIES: hypothetical protein [Bacteria]QDM41651.1 hypothetical protein C0V74_11835 [Altererythrobacter sp. TH136]TCJ38233.1 hypothetical protein E0504_14780 [Parafrankia sp. BMG5.11]
MRQLLLIASLAALAACNNNTAPADAESEATADVAAASTPATAPAMAADGKDPVGKFRITTSDGRVVEEEVKADGTYVSTADGKTVETGRWVQKSPTTYCYTKTGETAEQCNTESVDAKGVWTTTGPDGKTATVVRLGA